MSLLSYVINKMSKITESQAVWQSEKPHLKTKWEGWMSGVIVGNPAKPGEKRSCKGKVTSKKWKREKGRAFTPGAAAASAGQPVTEMYGMGWQLYLLKASAHRLLQFSPYVEVFLSWARFWSTMTKSNVLMV